MPDAGKTDGMSLAAVGSINQGLFGCAASTGDPAVPGRLQGAAR